MTIRDTLIEQLRAHFPDRRFVIGNGPDPLVTFEPQHPEVGEVRISEEDAEAIVAIGDITHGHFACYDETKDADAKRRFVVEGVVEFLGALFEDRVLLWSHVDGGSGGFEVLEVRPDRIPPDQDVRWFLWSGPLECEVQK